jgi:hypothetical protein
MSDLLSVKAAIEMRKADSASQAINLCSGDSTYCEGRSNELNATQNDGSGWIKIDLSKGNYLSQLPIDPVNSDKLYYHYCSDGATWEIDAIMESKQSVGSDVKNGVYKVGDNLNLCKTSNSIDLKPQGTFF